MGGTEAFGDVSLPSLSALSTSEPMNTKSNCTSTLTECVHTVLIPVRCWSADNSLHNG